MPQQTNLNVAPYFDDFESGKDFHKVLFKPGSPVQARELTTLQSMLQDQVEQLGSHFFKEGKIHVLGRLKGNVERETNKDGKLNGNLLQVKISPW